jgi:uroporphyrinogen-III synthase
MASVAPERPLRALVTRPDSDSRRLAQALAERGVEPLIEPMMQIAYRDAAVDLTGIRAVLCTSANGVRALARSTAERGVPLFAVGDATAACAGIEGFCAVESAAGNAADLIRLVAARLRPQDGPLLHVCGREVAGDLAAALLRYGFSVEPVVLYEARAVSALSDAAADAFAAGTIDVALFFSPRTAATFTRLAEAAELGQACATIVALSISPAAYAALGTLQWAEHRIAKQPTQDALLALLDDFLIERRRG